MSDTTVLIALGLGSNIGDGHAAVRAAADALARGGVADLALSPLYATSPIGPPDQPDYTNAAATGRTALSPRAVLDLCKRIERDMGRPPGGVRWGPRPIDIDILLYGDLSVNEPDLMIPHPELGNRLFALVPLLAVAPDWPMPAPRGGSVRAFAAPRIIALRDSGQIIRKIY